LKFIYYASALTCYANQSSEQGADAGILPDAKAKHRIAPAINRQKLSRLPGPKKQVPARHQSFDICLYSL